MIIQEQSRLDRNLKQQIHTGFGSAFRFMTFRACLITQWISGVRKKVEDSFAIHILVMMECGDDDQIMKSGSLYEDDFLNTTNWMYSKSQRVIVMMMFVMAKSIREKKGRKSKQETLDRDLKPDPEEFFLF